MILALVSEIPAIYRPGWWCLIPVAAFIIGIATGWKRK